jgi:hypothetical protein
VEIENFRYAHSALGSKVDYREMDLFELTPKQAGYFDIVLFLGVLYHLKHPLLGLEKVCELTRELAIVESLVVPAGSGENFPAMEFYETDELGEQLDNWFGPNVPCLLALCRTAGFARAVLLDVSDNRAVVACYRQWAPPASTGRPAPALTSAFHGRNYGLNFYTHRDEYVTCWFTAEERALTRETVFPEAGGYGVPPIYVNQRAPGVWQASFKLPPGLAPGWHDARLRTASSQYSNALRIAVDIPPRTEKLVIRGVWDGLSWKRGEAQLGASAFVSLWARGLPENADCNNVRVRMGGMRHSVDHIGAPDEGGFRQVNVRLRANLAPGEHDLVISFGDTASQPFRVTLKPSSTGTASASDTSGCAADPQTRSGR